MLWNKSDIPAPGNFLRPIDSVAHGNLAFFRNCFTCNVYSCDKVTQEWCQLPDCPVADTSLAMLPVTCQGSTQFRLHTVGGRKLMKKRKNNRDEFTGIIYQLQQFHGHYQWEQHSDYPDMKNKRSQVTVAYNDGYVIAAGGCSDYGVVSKVEVWSVSDKEWSEVVSLPQPVFRASQCVCNGQLYILGGHVRDLSNGCLIPTKAAYVASIKELIDSLAQDEEVFKPIAPLRLKESACVAFCNYVVAIGGWKFDATQSTGTKLVYVYDKDKDSWTKLKRINEQRCQNLAAAFDDTIMTVGGYENPSGLRTNSVEFATGLSPL